MVSGHELFLRQPMAERNTLEMPVADDNTQGNASDDAEQRKAMKVAQKTARNAEKAALEDVMTREDKADKEEGDEEMKMDRDQARTLVGPDFEQDQLAFERGAHLFTLSMTFRSPVPHQHSVPRLTRRHGTATRRSRHGSRHGRRSRSSWRGRWRSC